MRSLLERKEELYKSFLADLSRNTDRIFAYLFLFQWALAIVFAFWLSPIAWYGNRSELHLHVYLAVFFGGFVAGPPIYLGLYRAGERVNRYAMALAQAVYSILFIHLTGGRIETHFHIFVSLAFLSFYRDMRPLLLATAVTLVDHLVRGHYWAESVYGVLSASPWRAFEHAAWVVFEDVVLFMMIVEKKNQLKALAGSQAELENNVESIEEIVRERTRDLAASHELILQQKSSLVQSSKFSALGEMAAGIAHEINNPVAIIQGNASQLRRIMEAGGVTSEVAVQKVKTIEGNCIRITKIISGLRAFARGGEKDPFATASVNGIVAEVLGLCGEKYKNHGIKITVVEDQGIKPIECRAVQILQVLVNLLNNSYDAVLGTEQPWVEISAKGVGEGVEIAVMDSGPGIPTELIEKIMQPFFTTKPQGKGTGIGLSISRGIVEDHGGRFWIDRDAKNTRFVFWVPYAQPSSASRQVA